MSGWRVDEGAGVHDLERTPRYLSWHDDDVRPWRPPRTTDEQQVADLVDELLETFPPKPPTRSTFLGEQFDRGLAWVHFPVGHGGLGVNPKLQKTINERVFAAGGAERRPTATRSATACAARRSSCGGARSRSSATCARCSPARRSGASCSPSPAPAPTSPACRRGACKDGDEWIVNGQKVWTTLAHLSKWGLLVVRTDPEAVKHAGLTAFVVDMQAPTVEVRPLRQMTGEAEFNEVYFTDTRIPDSERLGEPGDGWRVSLTTLMNERVSIGGSIPAKGSGSIAALVKAWKDLPEPSARTRPRATR